MQFNSESYLLLLLCATAVFWVLPSTVRRWYVLALSIAFYSSWGAPFLSVPIVLCIGVFVMARKMTSTPLKRPWLWGGIAYALALLVLFRYQDLINSALGALEHGLRLDPGRTLFQAAVPLGISFYTLEAISYLVDLRQGRIKTTRFRDLYLFLMFWPNLGSGPIARFRELVPQFSFEKQFELSMLTSGLDRLVWGVVQKNLFANPLGVFVNEGFLSQTTGANTWLDNWFLSLAFGLQIYFDFAAYSNMAIGTARMIGVTLPENFRFPYHAKDPSDFWRRWHITLSRWIRDYLFFPANVRSEGRSLPLYISLIGIMGMVGLWHGAGCGFLIWGVLHGGYLVAYRVWERAHQRQATQAQPSTLSRAFLRSATLMAVLVAWVPFRATSFHQAVAMLRSMFFTFTPRISFSLNSYLMTLLIAAVCVAEPLMQECLSKVDGFAGRHVHVGMLNRYLLRPLLYAFGLFVLIIFDERNTQFIYFQF